MRETKIKMKIIRRSMNLYLSIILEWINKCLVFFKKLLIRLSIFIDAFIITLVMVLVLWALDFAIVNNEFLNPFERAFRDFQYTDILYSQIKKKQLVLDTNIVLVSTGKLDRKGIAKEIEIVQFYKPKVIGVDIIFSGRRDTAGNSNLKNVISSAQNIVLAKKIIFRNNRPIRLDTIAHLFGAMHTGHINFPGENPRSTTIREFQPYIPTSKLLVPSLAVKIAQLSKPMAYENFSKRNYTREIINYTGTLSSFPHFSAAEIIDQVKGLEIMKGKIVIMGHFETGASYSFEDKYFTPFNEELSGRSWPDMYGIVIHANILSMILRGDYIDQIPLFTERMIAIILCFFSVLFLMYLFRHNKFWYDPASILIPVTSSIVILYIIFQLYAFAGLKFNATLLILLILLSSEAPELYDFIIRVINRYFCLQKKGGEKVKLEKQTF